MIKKRLSQHFLVDKNIINKIIKVAQLKKEDKVLEIGSGTGNLTFALAQVGCKVLSIEVDKELVEELIKVNQYPNVEILHNNFLDLDLDRILKGDKWKVIANIPYHITSPILEKLLNNKSKFEYFILMVQKELAKRMIAKPSTSDYSAFTIFIQFHTEPKILFYVKKTCFFPQPKVTSAVIKLVNKEELHTNKELFFRIVRGVFTKRRKKILNALHYISPEIEKEKLTNILIEANIDTNKRPQEIKIEEFVTLTQILEKNCIV